MDVERGNHHFLVDIECFFPRIFLGSRNKPLGKGRRMAIVAVVASHRRTLTRHDTWTDCSNAE
jgi:hypothetical protein